MKLTSTEICTLKKLINQLKEYAAFADADEIFQALQEDEEFDFEEAEISLQSSINILCK